jgi:hypothetical protein
MIIMKKSVLFLGIIAIWIVSSAAAQLALPWKDHAAPFSFLFGNEIDTHQQSVIASSKQIQGYLYIRYTGETIDGIPVAEHTNCSMMAQECRGGWKFAGSLTDGVYNGHNMDNHMPQFCLSPDQVKSGYTHFHWLGDPMMDMGLVVGQSYPGYMMKLVAVDTFYFRHHEALTLVKAGPDTISHLNIRTDCQ